MQLLLPGVNKKTKKFKTVWHGFRGILKLSGRVNQASLKLSASFSIIVQFEGEASKKLFFLLLVKKTEALPSPFFDHLSFF